jgi:hypothetical protein
MTESEHIQDLLKKQETIAQDLAGINDFRPGSLVKRFRRCGKPNCHCAQEGDEGHGPSYSLTRAENGKTITKIIPAEAVEGTKEQIAEYRKFKELVNDFTEINIQMCDAKLSAPQGFSETEEAQKKGSKKHLKRKLPGKSKRS